jgi:hypothetical protein
MLITILYAIWILYTVSTLSFFGLLFILSRLAAADRKKREKQLAEMMKHEYKDTDW